MSRIEEAIEKASRLRDGTNGIEIRKPVVEPTPLPQPVIPKRVDNPLLVSANSPNSPAAEEYRKLKSILVKLTKQENFQNVIMVTSSVGGEGKSITSLNLAISLAQEYDHTVLLLDADLRKPSVHKYLGIESDLGLADCLIDGIDIGNAIIKTGIGNLSLIPAGKAVNNPAELFSSQKMKDLLLEMKYRYADRYIIIDVPPILLFAETHAISNIADGVVLVVKDSLTSMSNIIDSLDVLKGSNMLGVVYNGACEDGYKSSYHDYYKRSNYGNTTEDIPPQDVNTKLNMPIQKSGFLFKHFGRKSKA